MASFARIFLGAIAGLFCAVPIGVAQTTSEKFPLYQQATPVVSINRERLLQNSEFGKSMNTALSDRQSRLVEENAVLEQDLEREELELTELRKALSSEEFMPLAEAFDAKVREVRRVQDQKAVDLAQALELARFRFFRQAERVIAQFMLENGIAFVLDESAVWISQGGDVTGFVIERLDAAYASGELAIE